MTEAAGHYKAVEKFMISEILPIMMLEEWQFQSIDNTAYGIYDAANQKPQECGMAQALHDW